MRTGVTGEGDWPNYLGGRAGIWTGADRQETEDPGSFFIHKQVMTNSPEEDSNTRA